MSNANASDSLPADQERAIVDAVQSWLEKAVIGLNLCPFAKSVHVKGQIRYVVSRAGTVKELQNDLVRELEFLAAVEAEQTDTTLLIHPFVLNDFFQYNDFLDVAEETVETLGLEGELQVASFHPDYQFADAAPDDISNFTNRSPFPILHLLREASIDRAVAAFPDASEIFERNIETLRRLGHTGWEKLGVNASKKSEN